MNNEYFIRAGFLVLGFILGRITMAIQCDFFIPKHKRNNESHIKKAVFLKK